MSLSDIANLSIGISSITVGALVTALLTLIICCVAIRIIRRLVRKLLSRSAMDERVQKYVVSGVVLALDIVAALIVVDCLGVPISSLVALISVGSLGVTLAAEDILGNMAGGFVILSTHQFAIRDYIEVGGVAGTVDEVTLNHTKLMTPDGQMVTLPNKIVASSQLTNYTVLGRRRIVRKVTASYDAPTESVRAACLEAVGLTPDILPSPAPQALVSEYGSSSIEYAVFCWCRPESYIAASYGLNERLRAAFEKAGVEMTYDHLNVHIMDRP